ncbi:unnamed protein product [Nippostrongylus brasiliensis]|uniref:Adaptin_N domain-containing protein n=1 Tax=Nippostrongylus brasiliensis TaxID=27835 RepID=A0A0N4XMB1_NIPBR|nr:unnamed protein product [Nippostrongylus brasiliensis]
MGDSRLNHLGSIFESKNCSLRREAAVAFGKYCLSDDKVTEVLLKYICSSSWDARVAAADAVQSILRNMDPVLLKYICSSSWDARVAAADAVQSILRNMDPFPGKIEMVPMATSLLELDPAHVLKTFKPLLSEDGAALSASASGVRVNAQQQRHVLDQHLDMSAVIGITSACRFAGFVNDLDMQPQSNSNSPKHESKEVHFIHDPFPLIPVFSYMYTHTSAHYCSCPLIVQR